MSIKEKWAAEIAEKVRNGASESDVLALLWAYLKEEIGNTTAEQPLQEAAKALLDAVHKHHPVMNMETQLDLYMAYHDLKKLVNNL